MLRGFLRLRKLDREDREEHESLVDLYPRAMESAWHAGREGGMSRRMAVVTAPFHPAGGKDGSNEIQIARLLVYSNWTHACSSQTKLKHIT